MTNICSSKGVPVEWNDVLADGYSRVLNFMESVLAGLQSEIDNRVSWVYCHFEVGFVASHAPISSSICNFVSRF